MKTVYHMRCVRGMLAWAGLLGVLLPCFSLFAQRSSTSYVIPVEDLPASNQVSSSAAFLNVGEFTVVGGDSSADAYRITPLIVGAVSPILSLQVDGALVADLSIVDFGQIKLGSGVSSKMVTVSNFGDDVLSFNAAAPSGDADFTSSPVTMSLNPGDSTSFFVSFSAAAKGGRAAGLSLSSNDGGQATLTLKLQGQGVGITYNDWKFANIGVDPNTQTQGSDTNGTYLKQYAFGTTAGQAELQSVGSSPSPTFSYTRRTDSADLAYLVEVSDDLQNWYSGSDYTTEISVTPSGPFTETVVITDTRPSDGAAHRFFRLRATAAVVK